MTQLSLKLLGGFSLLVDAQPVAGIAKTRMQDLLVYLFLHRSHPELRAQVASALWPETNDVQSLKNLRTIYARLRDLLPTTDLLLNAENQSMQWKPDAPIQVDVTRFEACCVQAEVLHRRSASEAAAAFEAALACYTGDLLPGDYSPWVVDARERLRQQWLDAHDVLATLLLAQGEARRALAFAQELVRADPLSEPAHMRRMEALLAMGNRAGALSAYHDCAKQLADELGVDPGAPMQRLYERVLFADEAEDSVRTVTQTAPAALPTLVAVAASHSRLVGRDKSMAWLQEQWAAACQGVPHAALLVGEAGIGKSRLAEQFAHTLSRAGGEVMIARAFPGAQVAYQAIAEWLGSPVVTGRLAQVDLAWRVEASRLAPALLAGVAHAPAPEPLTQAWQTHRFLQGMAEVLLAGCEPSAPRLLVLEDAHWVDADTIAWLPLLFKAAAGRPLMLLLTARLEDAEANEALKTLQESMPRTGEWSEHALMPLDAAETAAVAAELAKETLTLNDLFRLHRESEGNPLFIVEMVRSGFGSGQATAGAATQGDRQVGEALNLPPAVAATLRSRLAQLSEGARSLAECAAVIGREVNYELLAAVSQMDENSLLLRLDELWRRRILREQGGDGYDFSHDKLRQVAYAGMMNARRRALHRRTGEALAARPRAELHAAQIAAHFEAAGNLAPAAEWCRRAADEATKLNATAEAVRLYQHLLEEPLLALLSLAAQYDVRLALGKGLMVLGRVRDAKAKLEAAIEDAARLNDPLRRAWAQYELGVALGSLLEDQEALKQLEAAKALFAEHGDRAGQMKTMQYIGQNQVYFGQYDAASANYAHVVELARETGDAFMLGDTLAEIGWLALDQWRIAEAHELGQQAMPILESIGAKEKATWTALLLAFSSDSDAEDWQWRARALVLAQETESSEPRNWAIDRMGMLLVERGQLVEGLGMILAALDDGLQLDYSNIVAYGAESLGRALARAGFSSEAQAAFRSGIRISRSIEATFLAARIATQHAMHLLEVGDVEGAAAVVAEARATDFLAPPQYFLPELFTFLEVRIKRMQGLLRAEEADVVLGKLLESNLRYEISTEVVYWRWRLLPNASNHSEAVRLLGERYATRPHLRIRQRYAELTGETLAAAPQLPNLATFAPAPLPLETLLAHARESIAALEKYGAPH